MLQRTLLGLAILGAAGASGPARAQQPEIVVLDAQNPPQEAAVVEGAAAPDETSLRLTKIPGNWVAPNLAPQVSSTPAPWTFDGENVYVQRFGVAHDAGDGIGFGDSFTTLEYMTPLRGDLELDNLFADCRFLVRNDATVGANLGVGYRHYDLNRNRIYGLNVFYDYRETDLNHFNQLGLGFESLGALIDIRGNAYIPDVDQIRGPVPNVFVGNLLVINRDEVAMTGGDLEIGVCLLDLDRFQARVYGGGYYFDGHGNDNAAGWRFRAAATVDQRFWVDASLQQDDVFGTTATIGLAYRHLHRFLPPHPQALKPMDHLFFRRSGDAAAGNIAHRLSAPIERLQNVVLSQQPTIATDPGGTPLNFLHVVDGAAGGGTFEDPYGTLSTALADPDAGTSIIYTPEGGDFVENVVLVPGATVLSNGPVQFVSTQFGRRRLPFSGASDGLMDLPTLMGDVTFDDDSRFSGFDVSGAVVATNVTGVTLDNSRVTNLAADAIALTGVDDALLDTLSVASLGGRGILLDDTTAILTDVTVTQAANDGVEITSGAVDRMVDINNLVVQQAAASGVDINLDGAGDLAVRFGGTNSLTAAGTAFDAANGAASTGDLSLALDGTTLSSTTGAGANIDGTAGAGTIFITSLLNNVITRGATGGFLLDTATFDADPTTAAVDQVPGGTLTIGVQATPANINGDGLRLIDPSGDLRFSTLSIFNRNGTGLFVDTKGGGTTFHLETGPDSTILTTNGAAMFLDPLTVDLAFTTLQSTNSPGSAIFLDTISGSITSGTTTLNGAAVTSIIVQNTPSPLNLNFGILSIQSTIGPTFAQNIDTTTGNGGNVTLNFDSLSITGP